MHSTRDLLGAVRSARWCATSKRGSAHPSPGHGCAEAQRTLGHGTRAQQPCAVHPDRAPADRIPPALDWPTVTIILHEAQAPKPGHRQESGQTVINHGGPAVDRRKRAGDNEAAPGAVPPYGGREPPWLAASPRGSTEFLAQAGRPRPHVRNSRRARHGRNSETRTIRSRKICQIAMVADIRRVAGFQRWAVIAKRQNPLARAPAWSVQSRQHRREIGPFGRQCDAFQKPVPAPSSPAARKAATVPAR